MGLKFRIFIKAEHNSMSSAAALLRKAASAASAPAPSPPPSSVGGGGQQAGLDKRGVRGKGGGKQPLTPAQIAANDAVARLKAEEAELKLLEVKAKKAEAQDRFDKAKSGASSVTAASTPRAQDGRGGGDFVTHDQFQAGINDLNGAITKGFDQVFSNQSSDAQQQALTNATLAGFVKMMGTNGTGFSLPAPVSRQIGNGQREEQSRFCFGQNEGRDDTMFGSNGGAATSSRASSAIEDGRTTVGSQHGGQNGWDDSRRMSQSSSYFPPPTPFEESISRSPADQRFPTSGSGQSAPAPQSLAELMRTIPEAAKGFRGLCGRILSDAAVPGAKQVPLFTVHKFLCAWQMSGGNDDLACALMALTYGRLLSQQRLQPGIATAMRTTDIGVFKEFFRRISVQYPSFVLTYNWKGPSGPEYKTPYGTFSSNQGILHRFIHEHILA